MPPDNIDEELLKELKRKEAKLKQEEAELWVAEMDQERERFLKK